VIFTKMDLALLITSWSNLHEFWRKCGKQWLVIFVSEILWSILPVSRHTV